MKLLKVLNLKMNKLMKLLKVLVIFKMFYYINTSIFYYFISETDDEFENIQIEDITNYQQNVDINEIDIEDEDEQIDEDKTYLGKKYTIL